MLELFSTWSALARTSNYLSRTQRSYLDTTVYLDASSVREKIKSDYPRYRNNLTTVALAKDKDSITREFYAFAQVLFPFHRDPLDNTPISPERPDTVSAFAQVVNNLQYILRSPDCNASWYRTYGVTPETGAHDRSWFIVLSDHVANLSLTMQASISD